MMFLRTQVESLRGSITKEDIVKFPRIPKNMTEFRAMTKPDKQKLIGGAVAAVVVLVIGVSVLYFGGRALFGGSTVQASAFNVKSVNLTGFYGKYANNVVLQNFNERKVLTNTGGDVIGEAKVYTDANKTRVAVVTFNFTTDGGVKINGNGTATRSGSEADPDLIRTACLKAIEGMKKELTAQNFILPDPVPDSSPSNPSP